MALRYSTTLPNAFDTFTIGTAKYLQLLATGATNVANTTTVTINPPGNEVFDTKWFTIEKLLNVAGPNVPAGFQATYDGTGAMILDGNGNPILVPL